MDAPGKKYCGQACHDHVDPNVNMWCSMWKSFNFCKTNTWVKTIACQKTCNTCNSNVDEWTGGNEPICTRNCIPAPWSGWGQCSEPCGGGKQTRTRGIAHSATGNGVCNENLSEERDCNQFACHCGIAEFPARQNNARVFGSGYFAHCMPSANTVECNIGCTDPNFYGPPTKKTCTNGVWSDTVPTCRHNEAWTCAQFSLFSGVQDKLCDSAVGLSVKAGSEQQTCTSHLDCMDKCCVSAASKRCSQFYNGPLEDILCPPEFGYFADAMKGVLQQNTFTTFAEDLSVPVAQRTRARCCSETAASDPGTIIQADQQDSNIAGQNTSSGSVQNYAQDQAWFCYLYYDLCGWPVVRNLCKYTCRDMSNTGSTGAAAQSNANHPQGPLVAANRGQCGELNSMLGMFSSADIDAGLRNAANACCDPNQNNDTCP